MTTEVRVESGSLWCLATRDNENGVYFIVTDDVNSERRSLQAIGAFGSFTPLGSACAQPDRNNTYDFLLTAVIVVNRAAESPGRGYVRCYLNTNTKLVPPYMETAHLML